MNAPARTTPELFSIEAEQALIGAVLVNNDAFWQVAEIVQPRDFYDPVHARVFDAMAEGIRAGRLVTVVTLRTRFDADKGLAEIGGATYLARLAGSAATILATADYARYIRDCARWRALQHDVCDLLASAGDALITGEPGEALERVEQALNGIRTASSVRAPVSIAEAMNAALDRVQDAMQRPGAVTGISTGLVDLDAATGGLQDTDLIIVAGRPSMGKSAFAIHLARAAAQGGHGVLFVSCEQSAQQIAIRFNTDLAWERGPIPYSRAINGQIADQAMEALAQAACEAGDLPLLIDTHSRTVSGIRATARAGRAFFAERGATLDLIVVDYLQLLHDSGRQNSRTDQVGEISGALKRLAMDLDVPVVALSQLNRSVESREDKRPQLHDLRASGDIEQDADVVIFPFREAHYLARQRPDELDPAYRDWQVKFMACENRVELIIAKQRMGPIDTVKARCFIASNAFRDL